ncbi:alpha/beta fold hydrolase [Pseudoalteromonas sp. C2R02]|uniref:alpha/beta hydrolase family protein n=1 Tax=Pseudoalteromonas sp. C2R02 TaxID=2841565 RepID=UPI001C08C9C3|nr:alpha/beta fold hydrolase [Pseudoalteromonas sp. C2R02]MBU2969634.1 alpha/beta fold hydrolase [Pseudoalteromonas sp. C2R02]
MKIFKLVFLLHIFAISIVHATEKFDQLFDHVQYQNSKISPDGKHFAVATLKKGKTILVFLERANLKLVGSASFAGNLELGRYYWVNNERVVINVVQKDPWSETPSSYGELYSVNLDGSKGKMIYGYRSGEWNIGSRLKKKESTSGWGEIIDILPEDKKHILVSSTPMSATGERYASIFKLNVYSGVIKKKLGRSPVSFSKLLTDIEGNVKIAVGTDNNNISQMYIKNKNDWKKVPKGSVGEKVYPLSISESGKYLYTLDNYQQDIRGVFRLNLEDFSYESIYTDKKVNVTHVEMTTNNRSAYAIRIDDGYPAYLILNKRLEEAKVFKDLLATFPYSEVTITSKTEKGEFYVVMVSSDIDPGTLYLFDKKNNKITALFRFKPKFKSSEFAQVEPINFESSDGKMINGYFTQAKSNKEKELAPVVVLVHGGPHGVRDYWEFSSQVQFLVAHGYSVLQVNYRGSGGFGYEFEAAGYKSWGSLTQKDIYDGYQWLVKHNKAKDNNVCIMGASFGAYSAVQSAAIFPETYRCVIANAGIYDLELMFEEGDVQQRRSGLSYLKRVLGTDEKLLKSMSPVNYVEKIQAPLLLAHGENDERAPFEHAERLREALDEANKTYEWFTVDKEGHGFYNPKNQKAYMKKVVGFLDKHLL